jgi:hypothetical protein
MIIPGLITDLAGLAVAVFFFGRRVTQPGPAAVQRDPGAPLVANPSDGAG